jgi:tRNA-specific 2-thiouridylase
MGMGTLSVINNQLSAKKGKVAIGLSGGVDSSVSAALLVEQGYEVTGVYIECYHEPGCRAEEDRKDALEVALKLNIPFKVLDMRKEYKEKVLEYFYKEYEAGRTPNPDTVCNREIKFGLFYDWAMEEGFDYVATGHYARIKSIKGQVLSIKQNGNKWLNGSMVQWLRPHPSPLLKREGENQYVLQRAVDEKKDQTYFLYLLRPEQLEHVLFPVGGMSKLTVRKEAKKRGLSTATKPDSQGICFVGEVNVKDFLKERIKPKKGKVVDFQNGNEIGEHDGIWFYTIGQRGGWKIDPNFQRFFEGDVPIFYVIGKDIKNNVLIVSQKNELYTNTFKVSEMNWLVRPHHPSNGALPNTLLKGEGNQSAGIRIRHGGKIVPCKMEKEDGVVKVVTKEFVWGIAPGQAAVFYDSDKADAVLLGGGVIV